ncbi:MAG TPA: 4Fe-4S dicluster domain-containing protein [Ignavibacteria bacterium]|nr:4Fe-4S dicluster domain-containing protein [Ignavibacteria bacterium]HAX49719.1 ferredoxin [Bacteroidota bacterium]HRE11800.1 4Fe-4S dicluster domain-containing protein [Ignavibacteria bacterium]HRF67372.1 4Fe-4S dicluster domain-containing protein [Ignavibacteria bacterium]HRJ03070.1 4Fe-4S dicluster domain-containing protein [Ignavibacteria bacterium]
MAVHITDDCINCSACETECPEHAIMPKLNNPASAGGDAKRPKFLNNLYMAKYYQSFDHYYVIPSKCSECSNVYSEPRCNAVCPVSCCITGTEKEMKESISTKVKIEIVSLNKICLN